MNNHSCSFELGKSGKRHRGKENTSDRLSHLPDLVLYHIVSFLDAKSAVQTSVLLRAWRCAWKHVLVIDLHSNSFKECKNFQSFVSKVLSLRYNLNVQKLSCIESDHSSARQDVSLFAEVIKYALSHDTQHLVIGLNNGNTGENSYKFSDLFGSVLDSNLGTLELGLGFVIDDSWLRSSGFRVLTTLYLDCCLLVSDPEEDIDLISNFPYLENLVLSNCFLNNRDKTTMNISGPELLSLKIDNVLFSKLEIFAPKLEFFSFCYVMDIKEFSKLSLPSMVHADIKFRDDTYKSEENWMARHLISLFRGLSNATSLVLDPNSIEELSRIFEFLEQYPSPFTRLESLTMDMDTIPLKVVNYLFKGSCSTYPKIKLRRSA